MPILSICIASYNKADVLYRSVKHILTCESKEFEIVIADDGSTDQTIEKLKEISDKRLKIFQNKYNRGAEYNWMKAMSLASGKYAFLLNDKDWFLAEKLEEFIELLKTMPDFVVGVCPYVEDSVNIDYSYDKYKICTKGAEALKEMAYLTAHPTGVIVSPDAMHKVSWKKYAKKQIGDIYPYSFLFTDLCQIGDAAVFNLIMWSDWSTHEYDKTHRSGHSTGTDKPAWFELGTVLPRLVRMTNDLLKREFEDDVKYSIWKRMYLQMETTAVIVYKKTIEHEFESVKYHRKCRKVSKAELFYIECQLAIQYSRWISKCSYIPEKDKKMVYQFIRRTWLLCSLRILNEKLYKKAISIWGNVKQK